MHQNLILIALHCTKMDGEGINHHQTQLVYMWVLYTLFCQHILSQYGHQAINVKFIINNAGNCIRRH
jgi:hypothetical protein